ncbi:hypothetical protein EBR11_04655 [bacterium]|nr:hypothetical protein [bacterium]
MRLLVVIRNLTGGQVPPLTRTALILAAVIFLFGILLFKPQSGGQPSLVKTSPRVRMLSSGDPLVESQTLLDPSVVYIPHSKLRVVQSVISPVQSEDAPLAGFNPILRFSPGKPVDLSLESPKPVAPEAHLAVSLSESKPFTSFGSTDLSQNALKPRGLLYEIYPLSGAKNPILKGNISLVIDEKQKKSSKSWDKAPLWSPIELLIGIDSMGMQAPARIIKSSGDSEVDLAVREWTAEVNWVRLLPPGSYRLVLGP